MDWRVKSALRRAVLACPGGENLYRWLTARVLGTQGGMAAKWFRVFPTHVRVLAEQFGDAARAQSLWCFDSGATIAAGLANAICSDAPGLLTDRFDRLAERYNGTALAVARSAGANLAQLSGAPAGRLDDVLARAAAGAARPRLANLGMEYGAAARGDVAARSEGRVGCIYSAGSLEHYRPAEVEAALADMVRALVPGGVLSHVIDHRDHRWHADKRVAPLAHLSLAEDDYERRFGNPLDYHNRWLQSHWTAAFERHGLTVAARTVIAYTDDLPPLDRAGLRPPWRDADESDLNALVTHFVAVKPAA
jgi:SAM-dependent methyltransferase